MYNKLTVKVSLSKLLCYCVFFFVYTLVSAQNSSYVSVIEKHRTELNNHFKDTKQSPLPKSKIKRFTGLPFYPIDDNYKIKAKLEFTFNTPIFFIQNTKGQNESYQQYAIAHFTLNGSEEKLHLYQSLSLKNKPGFKNYLFVPFYDTTNGTETYKGGRYLDLQIPKEFTGYITIDFNKAYNPYCAYNKNYACPIPPKENNLSVAVKAGVKK